MKIQIGLSQKRGLPNYGSAGASCQVEVELDSQDPAHFQQQVREAFAACRQAVQEELARTPVGGETAHQPMGSEGPRPTNGSPASYGLPAPYGAPAPQAGASAPRPATPNQVKAIRAIAHRAGIDLAAELAHRYGVQYPHSLDLAQASQLIDALKERIQTQPAAG
jgi:hypothetical protein